MPDRWAAGRQQGILWLIRQIALADNAHGFIFSNQAQAATGVWAGAALLGLRSTSVKWGDAQMRGGRQGACKGRSKVIVMLRWAMGLSWAEHHLI